MNVSNCEKACRLAQIAVARETFRSGRGGGALAAMPTAASPAIHHVNTPDSLPNAT